MAVADQETIRANWRVFVACAVVTLSSFQYGVDFGLIGGLQAMQGFLEIFGFRAPNTPLGWNLTTERQQLISSLMTLGAFISSGGAGFLAIKLGRKHCIWLSCLLCAVSNIIMMTTESIEALYAGRFINGLANGGFMTFAQLYIQESSPAKYRGLFLTTFQFGTSFGTLIGTIVDWATSKRPGKSAYLIPLGIIYIVPSIITVGLFFIPESPRWLLLKGRREEGVKSLARLRPDGADVEDEASVICAAILKEQELASSVGFLDVFRNPIDRRRTIIAVCGVTSQAATGSMFIIAYKAYFFGMAKVADPFAMSCVLSTIGLLALVMNSLVVVRYGRRRVMLMSGLTLCGILQLIIAITYDKNPGTKVTGKVLVALSCLYMMSYNGMVAPYAWLTGGEMPSQRLRSFTFGISAAVGFFMAWLTQFTAPYFINPSALNWGPRYGYIWFPASIVTAVWVFFFLPEVKGRTLEEVDEMFEAKIPARKFRQYVCVGPLGAAEMKLSRVNTQEQVKGEEHIEDKEVAESTAVQK
ncbi:MFS general substrate transporter [Venustampulla echinocandica]|uniref:MFS general substrate transporter n=1 Tax=Venustampulla echinocandica TaxID=2656787 RepID=A0A370T8S2_9HELO|nr:MFS general substrate transporter [Venustampulla echinocandica]RDL29893.1 MFS general substrate transporter [Venustampulla echinocandica]